MAYENIILYKDKKNQDLKQRRALIHHLLVLSFLVDDLSTKNKREKCVQTAPNVRSIYRQLSSLFFNKIE